ncbi:MAG: branched-chain amino acid aminotransferase [Sphingobacteriia bacterium]
MIIAAGINMEIEKTGHSRLNEKDWRALPFGSVFADHMLEMHYEDGIWQAPRIVPFGPVPMLPSISALHYGQTIFEGMKAYRDVAGRSLLFRPKDHLARLNKSAERLCMPAIPEDVFIKGLEQLIKLDEAWVPSDADSALYLRPIYFATDPFIGVKVSTTYSLYILTCPVHKFYTKPVNVWVERNHARAAEGGVGYVKTAGNYARSMLSGKKAKEQGYDVVLWLDATHRRFVEEFSTMNAFFVIDDFVVTPRLSSTILAGITRDTIIHLLREQGIQVFEREVSIDELHDASQRGLLKEAFGSGTAAVVMPVASLTHEGRLMQLLDPATWQIMNTVAPKLAAIRAGQEPDAHNWIHYIDV